MLQLQCQWPCTLKYWSKHSLDLCLQINKWWPAEGCSLQLQPPWRLRRTSSYARGNLKFVPDTNSWLPAKLFLANLKDFEATTLQPEVWSPSHCIVKLVLTISTDYVLSANFVNYVNCFNRCRCAIITRSWQSLFVFGFNFAAVSCYIIT